MGLFPKEKELAALKQLFLLHGNNPNFLHAPPLNAGTLTPTSTSEAMLRQNLRPHFLSVKWKERYEALKRKGCLSEASSFPLAEYPTGIAQKVQTAVFLFCYFFSFCCQKEKSNISNYPNTRISYRLGSATNLLLYSLNSFP